MTLNSFGSSPKIFEVFCAMFWRSQEEDNGSQGVIVDKKIPL